MKREQLDETVNACLNLIEVRFPQGDQRGAAAMLLADGTVLTGTAPDAVNPAVEVCHCLLYTSPSPRDVEESRMPSSA